MKSQCEHCLGFGRIMVQRVDNNGVYTKTEDCPYCQETNSIQTCRECKHFVRAVDDFIAACGAPVPMHVSVYVREMIAAVGPNDDATKCPCFEREVVRPIDSYYVPLL